MKNGKKILCGLALSAMMMLGQNSFAQAGTPCFDITYDGYCDGASFCVDTATGVMTSGSQTGCVTGATLGTVGQIMGQGTGVTMGYAADADFAGWVTAIRQNGTWTHYKTEEGGTSEVNSGTWSSGGPALTDGGGVSSSGK